MSDPIAARHRARIQADGFRRLADRIDAEHADRWVHVDFDGRPIPPLMTTTRLRAEADRLDPKETP